jgi:hypothetical protein
VQRKLTAARSRLESVLATTRQQGPAIGQRTLDQLAEAEAIVERGLAERNPAFFQTNGGVPQQIGLAEDLVKLATAVAGEQAKPLVDRLEAVKDKARQAGNALKAEIIAANEPPRDAYTGSDAQALKAGAAQAWTEAHPDDVIVATVIPTPDWKREAKWTWFRDAFYFSDRSDLQAAVIIEATDEAGAAELHWFPVDIAKNHENNDALSYSPWTKDPLETLDVRRRLSADALD